MSSSDKAFTTGTFGDGAIAVVRFDPLKPRFLEVIAIFSDAARVHYAQMASTSYGTKRKPGKALNNRPNRPLQNLRRVLPRSTETHGNPT